MTTDVRAETVGSLLRPPELKAALLARGELSDGALESLADAAVLRAIALQESAGLDVITDGEMRRFVRTDPTAWVSGYNVIPDGAHIPGHGPEEIADFLAGVPVLAITEPLELTQPRFYHDEFAFLQRHANTRTKITLTAPSMMRSYGYNEHSRDAYSRMEDSLLAVRDLTHEVARGLAEMGCTYIQLDAPSYTCVADPAVRELIAAAGNKFGEDLAVDAEVDSSVFDGLQGVTRSVHLCRGNGPGGSWIANRGYDAIAADLFPRLRVDRPLLEFDDSRSGGFEPLCHVPNDTVAVLGLVTKKSGVLEDEDALRDRIREGIGAQATRRARHQSAMRLRFLRRRKSAELRRTGCEAPPPRLGGARHLAMSARGAGHVGGRGGA